MNRKCIECNSIFVQSGRGRPAVRCADCRVKTNKIINTPKIQPLKETDNRVKGGSGGGEATEHGSSAENDSWRGLYNSDKEIAEELIDDKTSISLSPVVRLPEVVRLPDVVRQVGEVGEWGRVVDYFKTHGGVLDRWSRRDKDIMIHALTYIEDIAEVESQFRLTARRLGLRMIRRELENEIF
jgi:hypothetical protein